MWIKPGPARHERPAQPALSRPSPSRWARPSPPRPHDPPAATASPDSGARSASLATRRSIDQVRARWRNRGRTALERLSLGGSRTAR